MVATKSPGQLQAKPCVFPSPVSAQCCGPEEEVWLSLLLMARKRMELLLARLLDQTVQVDLCRLLRQVNALQPRMVENVF